MWRQEKIPEGWSTENNDPTDTPVYSPATQTNNREVSEIQAKPMVVKKRLRKKGGRIGKKEEKELQRSNRSISEWITPTIPSRRVIQEEGGEKEEGDNATKKLEEEEEEVEAVNWKREEKLERVRRKKLEWHGVAACRSLLI